MKTELKNIELLAEKIKQGKMKDDLRWETFSQVFINEAQKASLIVDCGAEFGYYINLVLKFHPVCQVLAYEPEPKRYEALRGFFLRYENVKVFPYALADHDGEIEIYKSEGKSASIDKDLAQWSEVEKYAITVPARKLDSLLMNQVPDIIKMDIEGAELYALAGMEQLLETQKPVVFLEYHKCFVESLDSDGEQTLKRLLCRHNYRIYDNFGRECFHFKGRVILASPERARSIEFDKSLDHEFMQKYRLFYEFVERLKENGHRFLIYGGGSVGKTVAALMPENTVCMVDAAADRKLNTHDKVESSQVYSVDSIPSLAYDFILVTTLGHEKQVIDSLQQRFAIAPEKIINLALLTNADQECVA